MVIPESPSYEIQVAPRAFTFCTKINFISQHFQGSMFLFKMLWNAQTEVFAGKIVQMLHISVKLTYA